MRQFICCNCMDKKSSLVNNEMCKIKSLIVGSSGIGKSTMLDRYMYKLNNNEISTTIGVDYRMKNVTIENETYMLQIWDTAGQERFYSIAKSYFRGSQLIFLCFSIVNRSSFGHLRELINDLNERCDKHIVIVLVGTCKDLESMRTVSYNEAREYADENALRYVEVSSKLNEGIDELFALGVKLIHQKRKSGLIELDCANKHTVSLSVDEKKKGYCCN
jgi:small GTP-binding protein